MITPNTLSCAHTIQTLTHTGMVVFRIGGENELTEKLLKRLNHRGNLHCVPSSLKGKYVIRFTVTSTHTTVEDICADWAEIRLVTGEILAGHYTKLTDKARVTLKGTYWMAKTYALIGCSSPPQKC